MTQHKLENGLPIMAYDINDFALAMGISRTTVYNLVKAGKLKTGLLAGKRIVPVTEADRLLKEAMAEGDRLPLKNRASNDN